MRTQTNNRSTARIIHHAVEKVLPEADFQKEDSWNTSQRSGVPILWEEDSDGDDGLESDLKFDPVLYAASEWNSNDN